MVSIEVKINRIIEIMELLEKMIDAKTLSECRQLQKQFHDLTMIFKLEDAVNQL